MKLFWLTLTAGLCGYASIAQQSSDSSTNQLPRTAGSASLFSNFTYNIKEFNKVSLRWEMDSASTNDYFVVERGKDSVHFETLEVIKRTNEMLRYELTDNSAFNGVNFYRIKSTDSSGRVIYSKILQVGVSGRKDFKFYPNPVDKFLIVETARVIDLQVISPFGAVLVNKELASGVQIIDVSLLGKGEYILRVKDKESDHVILEHLLKN